MSISARDEVGRAVVRDSDPTKVKNIDGVMQRHCSGCDDWFVLDAHNFYKDKNDKYGFARWCRRCASSAQSISQSKRYTRIREQKEKLKIDLLAAKSALPRDQYAVVRSMIMNLQRYQGTGEQKFFTDIERSIMLLKQLLHDPCN